jgi:hypothetical protein
MTRGKKRTNVEKNIGLKKESIERPESPGHNATSRHMLLLSQWLPLPS